MKKMLFIISTFFIILFGIGAYTTYILIDKMKPTMSKTLEYLKEIELQKILVDLRSMMSTPECQKSIERNLTFDRLFNISLGDAYLDFQASCVKLQNKQNCFERPCKARRMI